VKRFRVDMMTSIRFGARKIGSSEPVVVIAEIGINHEGDAEICARMIEEAVKAGADAIKLQTIDPDRNYQPGTESHRLFSGAVLGRETTARMFAFARELGAEPFTTAGDLETLEWVERLDPAAHKISSGLLTCTPVIAHAARYGRSLVMSTGMGGLDDIDQAITTARDGSASGIALLHCVSLYPAPLDRLNLASIGWLERHYGVPVGFSDHSQGIRGAALAVAAGATVIEKHFSLDPSRPSYDHAISVDPRQFREMVRYIRVAELARGRPTIETASDLFDVRRKMGRYLAVIAPVKAGEQLDEHNLAFLRLVDITGALPASAFDAVRGAHAAKDLAPFTPLTESSIVHG
jgi:N,N'-diacetyllegionaminate synthase